MKKTLKIAAIIAIFVATIMGLTGCGTNKSKESETKANVNPIIGSWKSTIGEYTYQFNEDGTGSYSYSSNKMEFTYKTEGSKIAITYKGNTYPFETEYEIKDDTLNVKDSFGHDTLYKKQ